MAIETSNSKAQPAVAFNNLHMTRLVIDQPINMDATAQPEYNVEISTRDFGVMNNVRYYDKDQVEPERIVVADYLTEAMTLAASGDMIMINALTAIQDAVAVIYSLKTGKVATVI